MSTTEKIKDPVLPILMILVLGGGIAGFYYWLHNERKTAEPPAAPVATEAKAEPQIRHPVQRPESADTKPLPPLAQSDAALAEAASGFVGNESFEKFFHPKDMVRRFVVTIDNLPRKKLAQRYSVTKPVEGSFQASGKGENAYINPVNYRRYTSYVRLIESVDASKLVATYAYFYPLFQEEHKNLGYPKQYFNDRVVEVIDDLLAAPDIRTQIKLVQPKVLYEFADPNLEGLSAGQKAMIRMGSENAARVKQKLTEIRRELTAVR